MNPVRTFKTKRMLVCVNSSSRTHPTKYASAPMKQVKQIKPRNENQHKYVELLRNEYPHIVVGCGAAGTGKTFWATAVGMEKLEEGKVSRIILTRPAVCVDDEQHGFLPGTLESKMKPWVLPIYDSLHHKMDPVHIEKMILANQIEIAPLAYMRGRTFENAWIILDEAQNCTVNQMKMVLTRIGKGSKLVITGDPSQHDRDMSDSGLIDLLDRLDIQGDMDPSNLSIVSFDEADVERHPVIPHIIKLYEYENHH